MEPRQPITLPNGRMRPSEAAYMIGLSVKTLAMMRCTGTGPAYTKIRGRIWYTLETIQEWLQSHPEQFSTAQKPGGGRQRRIENHAN